jgi:hypothetical protein
LSLRFRGGWWRRGGIVVVRCWWRVLVVIVCGVVVGMVGCGRCIRSWVEHGRHRFDLGETTMLKATREFIEGQAAAIREAVADHVSSARMAILKEIGRVEMAVTRYRGDTDRALLEAEDRANERHTVAGRWHADSTLQRAALLELLGETASKVDRLLEHETRARNEQKVVRRKLGDVPVVSPPKGGIPAEMVPIGNEKPESVDAAVLTEGAWDRSVPSLSTGTIAPVAKDVSVAQRVLAGEKVDVVPRADDRPVMTDEQRKKASPMISARRASEVWPQLSVQEWRAAMRDGSVEYAQQLATRLGGWSAPKVCCAEWVEKLPVA